MSMSVRLLLMSPDGELHRLAEVDFGRLCAGSGAWRVAAFAGERVRWASLIVELIDRSPIRVVHRSFTFLSFDELGRIDANRMNREQVAPIDVALAPPVLARKSSSTIIDASSQFEARGGSLLPDARLTALLDEAALGRLPSSRIKPAP
jgi:hypothetical protein